MSFSVSLFSFSLLLVYLQFLIVKWAQWNAFRCFLLAFNKLNPYKVAIKFLFFCDLFLSLQRDSITYFVPW